MTNDENYSLWILGPTSSGKTTIGEMFLQELRSGGKFAIHYDGDEVRGFFGDNHGFSASDRLKVVKTLCHLANKSRAAGATVIVSALTANQEAREYVNENVRKLLIVYIRCQMSTCIERDPKGLYMAAKEGKINTLIGYNTTYNTPEQYDILLDTDKNDVETCLNMLKKALVDLGY